jgi:hypothetical protein
MKPLALLLLLLAGCTEFCPPPAPDYVGLCDRVSLAMGERGERLITPPIVFVRNSYVLGAMFPALEKPGERLLGVYHVGIVYLSQPDTTDTVIKHEYAHYFGADEKRAKQVQKLNP